MLRYAKIVKLLITLYLQVLGDISYEIGPVCVKETKQRLLFVAIVTCDPSEHQMFTPGAIKLDKIKGNT